MRFSSAIATCFSSARGVKSPRSAAATSSFIARGAMFAMTEMTPFPPQAMYGRTVKSSPDR